MKNKINSFLLEFGLNDKSMKFHLKTLGYKFKRNEDFSEIAINEDFIWLEKYNLWVNKEDENDVLEYLIDEKFSLLSI
jgi:hypothetical protein